MKVLYVTCKPDDARGLAERLLEERLVACASILPGVESVYRWEGRVECERETVLWMETNDDRVEAAIARLEAIHPYDVPKIVALEVSAVNAPYLRWVADETQPLSKT